MIVLLPHHRGHNEGSGERSPVALFGVGLIGSAIRDSLVRSGYSVSDYSLSWINAETQRSDLKRISTYLDHLSQEPGSGPPRFVWSAGRAGFGSDDDETSRELESFRRVLALAKSTSDLWQDRRLRFLLAGSVGGLFEGQRHIGLGASPRPLRHYGRLKLEQEILLAAESDRLRGRVYRLTSVFGPSGEGRRKGLISTLIENCYRHETTRIFGNASTLRDYVWSRDIGDYIARDARSTTWSDDDTVRNLGSGKPTSIHEIVHDIEGTTGLKALLQFEAETSNSRDITLASSILPTDWVPTDLKTAVRKTCLRMTAS